MLAAVISGLCLAVGTDAPANTLYWPSEHGRALARSVFPGKLVSEKLKVSNRITSRFSFTTTEGRTEVLISKAFPAVVYDTDCSSWSLEQAAVSFHHAAYETDDHQLGYADKGRELTPLGAPWVLLWNDPLGNADVYPVLVRFQRKPKTLVFDGGLRATFASAARNIAVMPLYGTNHGIVAGVDDWRERLGPGASDDAAYWSRVIGALPIDVKESYKVDKTRRRVTITDRFQYRMMPDEWDTKPIYLAPVPPMLGVAEGKGYPVGWEGGSPKKGSIGTLLGSYMYFDRSSFSYSLPIGSAKRPLAGRFGWTSTSKARQYTKLSTIGHGCRSYWALAH